MAVSIERRGLLVLALGLATIITDPAATKAQPLGGPDDIGITLAQNPDLKVLVVHGYQDLVTNYFLSRYVLEQSTRGPEARKRLFFGTYHGGHMFYLRRASRSEFTKDVQGFFEPSQ